MIIIKIFETVLFESLKLNTVVAEKRKCSGDHTDGFEMRCPRSIWLGWFWLWQNNVSLGYIDSRANC